MTYYCIIRYDENGITRDNSWMPMYKDIYSSLIT